MCSARSCLIIWTSLLFALALTLLILVIVQNKDKPGGFTEASPLVSLICISIVVVLNFMVLLGAICKLRRMLCIANFFIGFILFSIIASFITWVVTEIINQSKVKKYSTGEVAVFLGFIATIFVILMIIPCIQLCTLARTRKNIENDAD